MAARVAPAAPAAAASIWGRRAVAEALRRGSGVERVYVARPQAEALHDIRAAAATAAVAVTFSTASELDELSYGARHQGVAAAVRPPPPVGIDDLLQARSAGGPPLMLAADQVHDVGNLGALLRTLEAADGAGVIVPDRRSAALTGGLARASAGASLRTRLVRVANVARALDRLREGGAWVYALDQDGDMDYDAADFDRAACLVVGNEARGVRPTVRKACDAALRIPMFGGVGSLNVAVAGGIVLYHAIRARGAGRPDAG